MNKFFSTIFLIILVQCVSAQDFSNRGKDFWVGYGYHQAMIGAGNSQDMILYFSSDVAATVTVDIPGIGWTRTYSVVANSVKESDVMPKTGTQNATLTTEGISSKGIHITSDQPIVAYAHIFNSSVSGATLLFPVNTLGQDYYSLNFTQKSNTSNSNSWAFAVATEDNTTVEITPSVATLTHVANVPFTVTLNKGQIYNLMGTLSGNTGGDLTGTRIRSISNGANSCKKIAVFSGAGRMSIYCSSSPAPTTSDNFIQQVFPKVAWGKKYLTVPTLGLTNNFYRIAVGNPATIVSVDGVPLTGLVNNFYYEFSSSVPKSITADQPVMVAQYITSTNNGNSLTCNNGYNEVGDPEMIYISPVEQTIDTITLFSTPRYNITEHHINVVIKTADKNSFTLDGAVTPSSFISHPQDPLYSYATFTVNQGQHKLQASGGFNAIAYGYGMNESYGYNAGTNIKDLYTYVSLQNQFTTVNVPSACINTNFLFAITLPYQPSIITWDFTGAASSITPSAMVSINNPTPDSTFIKDGKTLYVYKIPGAYSFTSAGVFPVKIITVNPTADGCSGQQENIYEVQVGPLPTANFSVVHNGCYNVAAQFTDASTGAGHPINAWNWNFGDNTTDVVQNPVKTYSSSGTYNVKLLVVNDIGCSNTITKSFIIEPQPVAGFKISAPACAGSAGSAITFSDLSTVTGGNIVKWHWGFGPGDSVINVIGLPVTKTYTSPGNYTVTLTVENASGCSSTVFSKTFVVGALPYVNFSMPGVCLPLGTAQFTNLSTIIGGSVASMNYLWNFGDGGTSTFINPTHNYTTSGPFLVKLTATSAMGCTKDSSISFSNIYPQPKAGFKYSPLSSCVGDSLTFYDTTTVSGTTVTSWYWMFSDGTSSNLQNPRKLFTGSSVVVKLYIKTAAGCFSDTATKTITFNKLPTAAFTTSGSTCQGQTFTINNQSVPNSGVLTNWYWDFGNGTTAAFNNGNSFTRQYDTARLYTIRLVVQNDKGCKSDTAKTTINIIQSPVVKFGLPYICENDPFAVFTDSSSVTGGGALTHSWNFGDVNATPSNPNTSNTTNGQHHYGTAGTYNVILQVATATGCSSVITKPFTVNSQAHAGFAFINTGTICGNSTIQLKNLSTISIGAITRLEIIWDSINSPLIKVIDTLPPSGKIYLHNYPLRPTAFTYRVVVRAFSGQTCVDDTSQSLMIEAAPKVLFNSVGDFCLNDSAKLLTASETTGIQGSGSFSGIGITQAGKFDPVIAGAGQSNIVYTFTSLGGCKDSASQNINVVANPVIQLANQIFVLQGGNITLNPRVAGAVTNYNWSPGTYLNNQHAMNPVSTPKGNISYQLVVSTAGGCSDSAAVDIVVLEAPQIPNVFSPNGDGVNDVWKIESLSSYPGCTVDVFDRYGQPVFSSIGYSKPWDGTRKNRKLPVGVYYYVINPKNGRMPFTGYVTILQ